MATWVQASSPIRDSARAATTWYGVESPAMPRPVTEGSGTGDEGVGDKGVGGVVTGWSAGMAPGMSRAAAGRFNACGQASFPPPAELLSWSESIPPRSPSITTQLSTGLTPYGPPTHH
ncbi:hypothetical protein GCM10010284_13280 [Streptomyces rubiginosohelvolus]|uniref:Uncharacterized protein n=1 Tax=Streptomyces rubiginosohelvolus TaxID=67362 RepID=A0ABQ3BLR2_9ACTN|nr:hypothetical protein GCM10010284_13280 [Streptomyces rubiginosohelvolus]GGZ51108.1 hypothetical protein GCM10010328_27170 [Streptomyces pluricolorescens]